MTAGTPRLVTIRIMMLLVLAGCARASRNEPSCYPIAGKVTLDGAPLSEGTVYFRTVSLGLIERFPIKDGSFSGDAVAGERRIEFSVLRNVTYTGPKMPGVTPPETVLAETLPAAFNTESEFTATVTSDGPNEFTFELKSR